MLTINQYVRPQSLDEAYELCQKKNTVVLGGMLWLKMQSRMVGTAIDLCDLGLDTIEETADSFRIGAMATLRMLETHAGLNQMTQNALADSVRSIVGVQFRNCATVGGSLFGRFGFSDVLTLFLALDADVELHRGGVLPLREFAEMPVSRDILVRVIVKKRNIHVAYQSQRNTKTDFPVLTCAVSEIDGVYRCVIGARPMRAVVFEDKSGLLSGGVNEDNARAFADDIAVRVSVGSNLRAGADYRRRLTKTLVRRALLTLGKENEPCKSN